MPAAINLANEYEAAAAYVAAKYGRPIDAQLMRALINVPQHVLDSIEDNPHQWAERVNLYVYANEVKQ